MIYEFGFRNYFSFKEGAVISFRKSEKDKIEKSREVYSILGIKGANASGKTHLIKALSFLADFCTRSFSNSPDSKIESRSFFNNQEETYFYIEFNISNNDYLYEINLTENSVFSEKLSLLNSQQYIFERCEENINFMNEQPELGLVKIRKNVSVISTLQQYELLSKDLHIKSAFDFFSGIISNVSFFGLRDNLLSVEDLSRIYKEDSVLFSLVKNVIIKSDLGIVDIDIREMNENEKVVYFPLFIHQYREDNEEQIYALTQYHESSGTIRLYTELWKYFLVLSQGGILALDEFDKNFHALILPTLLDFFENNEVNTKQAQFLFTAHNTEIMDYLGKYRTILVEKEESESFCYRLDEIQGDMLIDGKPISPLYLKGRLGGVPQL